MASVAICNVGKSYGALTAVRDASLTVNEGEFVVLLGPSGCGKTTTLRIVAGFVRPTQGRVLIGGEDVTDLAPRSRNIGMVFQNYALFPNMNVAENIAFGLRQKKVPRAAIEARVTELLELIQMPGRGSHPVMTLSGGQQQRVALARALAASPRVLLMDEPLGALDARLRETMQLELTAMQRRLRITTILVTHDQHEAMVLADRIVVIADGRIQQTGTSDELYRQPRNRFVAEFIGANNILPGRVGDIDGETIKVELRGGNALWTPIRRAPQRGETVDLAIRPQHVGLAAPGPGTGDVLTGQVAERRFLGNRVNYSVRLASDEILIAECPGDGNPLEPGTRVTVTLSVEHIHLFDSAGRALRGD
jgi:putative spermidine/putrescine transport system ATP-binding protein